MTVSEVKTCAACGGSIVHGVGPGDEFCSVSCMRAGRTFCKFCQKPLEQLHAQRRMYCNTLCQNRYERLVRSLPSSPQAQQYQKRSTCLACGKEIVQHPNGLRLYCKKSCGWRFRRAEKAKRDLTQEWGEYRPEVRKCLREVQQHLGIGAAKRFAIAISHEYYPRMSEIKESRLIVCFCKTCGKEFRRYRHSQSSKDYCTARCNPLVHHLGRRKSEHYNAKLSWEQVTEIRRLYAGKTVSRHELASTYGVTPEAIGLIVNYKTWKPEDDPRQKKQG